MFDYLPARRLLVARLAILVGMLTGIALSLPLWRTRVGYAQAPVLGLLPPLPFGLDWVLLLAFCAGLAWVLTARLGDRRIAITVLGIAGFFVLQDQSRLQPWFFEYVLLF